MYTNIYPLKAQKPTDLLYFYYAPVARLRGSLHSEPPQPAPVLPDMLHKQAYKKPKLSPDKPRTIRQIFAAFDGVTHMFQSDARVCIQLTLVPAAVWILHSDGLLCIQLGRLPLGTGLK